MAEAEYLPGDNLPLPSTPPQEPCGTFSPAMHTRQRPGCLPSCPGYGPWHTLACGHLLGSPLNPSAHWRPGPMFRPFRIEQRTRGRHDDPRHETFVDLQAAEKRARGWTKALGYQTEIYQMADRWTVLGARPIAVVLRDALDRVWTEVTACPGQPCLL